jgi:Cu2+-exporting ATPase
MSCCAPGIEGATESIIALPSDDEVRFCARDLGDGRSQVELSVPQVHCGACISTVENGLTKLDGVEAARVNLSSKRVTVRWQGEEVPPLVATLAKLGYTPNLADDAAAGRDGTLSELIRAVAVAGFAASNIMLLSVSVWSGAEGATRDLFHWVSALIALPAMLFAGRIYYRSAWSVLKHGRMNMDVPIAIGITMAYALSLYETIYSGAHAYFDASVTLLFFLLIGRTLDHVMRERARTAVIGLARLQPRGALVVGADGAREYRPIGEIEAGMSVLIAAGERIPVDATVLEGASDLDCSLVNGESAPQAVGKGATVRAGTLNLTGPLTLQAIAPASGSFLAEMLRMMEAAEGGRARYRRIADRVSAMYAPVVHLTALLTMIGWVVATGDWHRAITVAIAVLIITCPCALGLAVPIVQVVAARRLFENGVMVRDGGAMERLAEADIAMFDKTGTLTLGQPRLVNTHEIEPDWLEAAAELGAHSRHPHSQAIATFAGAGGKPIKFTSITEIPGQGVEGHTAGAVWRLGKGGWAGNGEGTLLGRDGVTLATFSFEDRPRADARSALAVLKSELGPVEMLSGDNEAACRTVADDLGIETYASGLLPAQKVARIEELTGQGKKPLMVGDGLNDAPALGAAYVSMAPATAADVGRNAADFVFLHESLNAVPVTLEVARRAGALIRQNVAIAIVYNIFAVPIAILGYVTPLIAAIAMSTSSIIVIANALRLGKAGR